MKKVTFIGGGSAKFVRALVLDLFSFEELRDCHITLMDVNRERLELARTLVAKIIDDRKLKAKVDATTNQRMALRGSDFVIITIMVGGYGYYKRDVEIPKKYGVLQTISDTTGPGAIMRILRTAPVLEKIAEDLAELSPGAWVLNYANPMAMNTGALFKCGHKNSVGLCHSVQGCLGWRIGKWLGIKPEEIDYVAAGINHRNYYLKLEHKGKSLYPALLEISEQVIKEAPEERTAFEILKYLGYFPAEGASHQAEYYPWFMKNLKTAAHYGAKVGLGYECDLKNFKSRRAEVKAQIKGAIPIQCERSIEYGSKIIHSIVTGELLRIYGNVPNAGLISNLPQSAVVEVPCMVDRNGITPCAMGKIPPQLAAAMTPHVLLDDMAVDAVLSKDKVLLRQALQADPLTGAILTLPRIERMLDELLAANKDYLKGWK